MEKINIALKIVDDNNKAMLLDTKAEVLWKLKQFEDAVNIIDEAIELDSSNQYYKDQKNKFLQSINVELNIVSDRNPAHKNIPRIKIPEIL